MLNVSSQSVMPHLVTKFQCVPLAPGVMVDGDDQAPEPDALVEEDHAVRVSDLDEQAADLAVGGEAVVDGDGENLDEEDPRGPGKKESRSRS